MAIVRYGAGITEFIGSIGGWTFQRNAAGSIVRLRPIQKKRITEKQSIAVNKHIGYLQLYSVLSLTNKRLWSDFAELHTKYNLFGQLKTLTGQNWFESINYNLQLADQMSVSIPPAYKLPVNVPNYSVNLTDEKIELIFDEPADPPNNYLIIRTTFPITSISKSIQSYIRLTLIHKSFPVTKIDITAAYKETHEIDWPPSPDPYRFIVSVMVQTVDITSGIASVGLIKQDSLYLPSRGIGIWIIEDTFIVQYGIGIDYMVIDYNFFVF